jgi:hypothetical protein
MTYMFPIGFSNEIAAKLDFILRQQFNVFVGHTYTIRRHNHFQK